MKEEKFKSIAKKSISRLFIVASTMPVLGAIYAARCAGAASEQLTVSPENALVLPVITVTALSFGFYLASGYFIDRGEKAAELLAKRLTSCVYRPR